MMLYEVKEWRNLHFSKVSVTFCEFRGPLAEFGGPRQGRGGFSGEPRMARGFLSNRGVSAEFARLAEFRASSAQRQQRLLLVMSSRDFTRSVEYRAKTAKAHKCAVYGMVLRGTLADHGGSREDRADTRFGCVWKAVW